MISAMKKLLLFLLFSSLISFGQEDIERYKVYETTNNVTSLLLDTATGLIWHLQISLGDGTQMKYPLNETELARTIEDITKDYNIALGNWQEEYNSKPDSIVSAEDKEYWKPSTLDERLLWESNSIAKNGRFKLYPTNNMFNFIMVDVINGRTWQVQWNIDENKRLVYKFY